MNFDRAEKIASAVNKINNCKKYLENLDGRGYEDEFTICYRGLETCELERDALHVLIDYYRHRLKSFEEDLNKLN